MKNLIVTPVLALLMCCSAFAQNSACDKYKALVDYDNTATALLTRLNSDYHSAIAWESIDADHPDAVKVREKIDREEAQIKALERPELPSDNDTHAAVKACPAVVRDFKATADDFVALVDELVKLRQQLRALRSE